MKHFDVIRDDHEKNSTGVPSKVKMTCNGIMKLMPYQGFYPALRAVQLGHLFSASYAPYLTGSSIRSTDGAAERLASLYQPFFAPGVFFNTIKSGIAVDYSVHTGSSPSNANTYATIANPFSASYLPLGTIAEEPDYSFPFEAILYPDSYLPITSSDPAGIGLSASVFFTYPHFTGSITGNRFRDCWYAVTDRDFNSQKDSGLATANPLSGTSPQMYFEWLGQSDIKYSLAANNFFAEVENFFLEKRAPTSFVSKAEKDFRPMISGSTYYMDVVLRKSDDFVSYEGPSGSFYFQPYKGLNVDLEDAQYGAGTGDTIRNALGTARGLGAGLSPVSARGMHYGPPYRAQGLMYGAATTGSAWFEDPSFAPHTPPYFYGDAIARVTFVPHESRDMSLGESAKFTLEEILGGSEAKTIYLNENQRSKTLREGVWMSNTGSATDGALNVNIFEAGRAQMQVSSSVNLFGRTTLKEVQYGTEQDEEGNFIPQHATSPVILDSQDAWVVETKFECPSINLHAMDTSSLGAGIGLGNEKYMTRGIWKGYGEPPTGSAGIFLQIRESFTQRTFGRYDAVANPNSSLPLTGSLINVCGFKATQQRVGEIASNRTISEAIVAVPINSKGNFFKIKKSMFKKQRRNLKDHGKALLSGEFGAPFDIAETSITQMIGGMKKFYLPPQMDFLKNQDIKPFAMYIFEFNHKLSKKDLSYIWQNVMPDIAVTARKVSSTLQHPLNSKYEFFGDYANGMPSNVRWMVFKVKQRAKNNYFNITKTSEVGKGFNFSAEQELAGFSSSPEAELPYSYNWPYDFCSLIEVAKIDSEVTFKATTITEATTIVNIETGETDTTETTIPITTAQGIMMNYGDDPEGDPEGSAPASYNSEGNTDPEGGNPEG